MKEQNERARDSMLSRLPYQLAWLYGSILVVSVLTVLLIAYWLSLQGLQQEENRLVRAMGNVVALAVGHRSGAEKPHIARLIREIKDGNPEIESIYVVSRDGKLLAHSNESLRDWTFPPDRLEWLRLRVGMTARLEQVDGHWIKELVLPFSAKFEQGLDGFLVMRVLVDDIYRRRTELRWVILGLGVAVAVLAMLLLLWASQRLARPLQVMAMQYRGMLDNTPMYVTIYDRNGRVLEASQSFLRDFPNHGPGTYKQAWLNKLPADLAKRIVQDDQWVLEQGEVLEVEYRVLWEGRVRYYETRKFPVLYDKNGRVEAMCSMFWDISRVRRAQAKFELALNALQAAHEGIVIVDATGVIEQINPSLCKMLGREEKELLGQRIFQYLLDSLSEPVEDKFFQSIASFSSWEDEGRLLGEKGEFPVLVSSRPVDEGDEEVRHYVFVFTDLTEKKRQEAITERLTRYDHLTDLPNRHLLKDRLRLRLSSGRRKGTMTALLLLNLDNFKSINDRFGHDFGDQVLQVVGCRLKSLLRERDTVARTSGDEFCIVISDIKAVEDVRAVVEKLYKEFVRPVEVYDRKLAVEISVGIAIAPKDSESADDLLRKANISLSKAKQEGKNHYYFFTQKIQDEQDARILLQQELQAGVQRSEFLFHYQPKVDLATGHMVGAEALIRWQHPHKGLLYPGDFIELAEQTGVIIHIMRQLLLGIKADLQCLQEHFDEQFMLAINVSPIEFGQKDFMDFIERLAVPEGWDRRQLELEITENMIMADVNDAVERMEELSRWGFSLAIDDFGTGFSSLNYLKRFPIDTLKIDRSFISDLPADQEDVAIVKAMIYMAQKLDLQVVAEGVETAEQIRWLHENGCRIVQGYYFGKPVGLQQLLEMQDEIQYKWRDAMGFVS